MSKLISFKQLAMMSGGGFLIICLVLTLIMKPQVVKTKYENSVLLGVIMSSDNQVLTKNKKYFHLYLDLFAGKLKRDSLNKYLPAISDSLAFLLPSGKTSAQLLDYFHYSVERRNRFIKICENIDDTIFLKRLKNLPYLKKNAGIITLSSVKREYPFHNLAKSLLGTPTFEGIESVYRDLISPELYRDVCYLAYKPLFNRNSEAYSESRMPYRWRRAFEEEQPQPKKYYFYGKEDKVLFGDTLKLTLNVEEQIKSTNISSSLLKRYKGDWVSCIITKSTGEITSYVNLGKIGNDIIEWFDYSSRSNLNFINFYIPFFPELTKSMDAAFVENQLKSIGLIDTLTPFYYMSPAFVWAEKEGFQIKNTFLGYTSLVNSLNNGHRVRPLFIQNLKVSSTNMSFDKSILNKWQEITEKKTISYKNHEYVAFTAVHEPEQYTYAGQKVYSLILFRKGNPDKLLAMMICLPAHSKQMSIDPKQLIEFL